MLAPQGDIPNTAGFTLRLIRADGSRALAMVRVDASGCHYCAKPSGAKWELAEFVGWEDMPQPFAIAGLAAVRRCDLLTRQQLVNSLHSWGFDASTKPPAKGTALTLNFPSEPLPLVRVTVYEDGKSTEGKTLFACQYYRRA